MNKSIIIMMTTPKEKGIERDRKLLEENLFFDNSEELILSKQENEDLKKKLTNINVDEKTCTFFKASHQFYKQLEKNQFIVSLEEIEKL